jgi:hypothetical protein
MRRLKGMHEFLPKKSEEKFTQYFHDKTNIFTDHFDFYQKYFFENAMIETFYFYFGFSDFRKKRSEFSQ